MRYNKNNKKSKKEIKKILEQKQKEIKNEVKYRASSIPSKNNKGYIEEESTGKLIRKRIQRPSKYLMEIKIMK
jgi:hypothetical protein